MPHDETQRRADVVKALLRLVPYQERLTMLICDAIRNKPRAIDSTLNLIESAQVLTMALSGREKVRLVEKMRDVADTIEREAFGELV